MPEAYLSLGSNMGDKSGNIARALALLAGPDLRVTARSADYRTAPWGPIEQDWFVNACARVETRLAPQALLARALEVERAMGRVRDVRWGPRLIDIDLLAMDEVALDTPSLVLPHPRLLERAFVLVPLAEIAPDLPIAGTTVARALARLDPADVAGVVRIPV
jgi:2-amino-4-hydroxy-6-hydroxymethyldihydropteridine diphosphokinase